MSTPPTIHLTAEFPHGVLPEVFGVISAAAPPDLRGESALPGSILTNALEIKGWPHFAAECVLPDSDEPRTSYAVIESFAKLQRLARDFIRPALFWVHRGEVFQMPIDGRQPTPLGLWHHLGNHPPASLHASGNLTLLDHPATALLCSTQCPGDKILEAYDWARRQCDEGGTVISGFHTPVEKDVLAILARRGANLIWVPGRDVPKTVDAVFKTPMDENRLLILSPFPYGKPSRPTKDSCSARNRFVLARTPHHYIPHIAPGSSLAGDLAAIQP